MYRRGSFHKQNSDKMMKMFSQQEARMNRKFFCGLSRSPVTNLLRALFGGEGFMFRGGSFHKKSPVYIYIYMYIYIHMYIFFLMRIYICVHLDIYE